MKIRTKLILAFMTISLSLLVLTNSLFYANEKKNLTKQIFNHLESVASIQQNRISGIFFQSLERWHLVASRTQLRISLAQFNVDGKLEHQAMMNKILADAKAPISDFRNVCILSINGTMIACTDPEKIGMNLADKKFFIEGLKEPRVDLFFIGKDQREGVYLTGPLYLDDQLLGVLVIESAADNILSSVSDYTGLGRTGETVMAGRNEHGDAMFLMPTRFDRQAALKPVFSKEQRNAPIFYIFSGIHDMLYDAQDYRGVKVLAATRHVEEADWGIAVKIDQDEALAPVYKLRNMLILVIIGSSILIILVSFYFARTITWPITRLTEVARKIAEGQLGVQADETRRDETGALARVFNKMTANLIGSRQTLEDKIHELQEREERISLLLSSTAEAIYGLDKDGKCTFCNPSCLRILGYKEEGDLLGKNMHRLIHHTRQDGSEYPLTECRIFQGLQDKVGVHVDTEVFWRVDGTSFWAEYWSHPVVKDNKVSEVVVAFIDITKRRVAEQEKEELNTQLRQAQKLEAVGTLAGGIAHDFNNILSAVIGFTELAKMKLPPEDPAVNDLYEVLKAGDRAKDLVKQILTFSRQTEYERKPLDVHLIVKEAFKLLRASIPTTIEIRENIDRDSGMVMADPIQIHQVLMNLGTNAYHAMRETGGVLAVELGRVEIRKEDSKVLGLHLAPGSYLRLQVSDTGHGIEQALMERIFDPYFTTKKKGEGTGMGLALVHGIVKNHGGHVTVYSEPGRGTSFHIYLPRVETGPVVGENAPQEPLPRGSERLLLVDDEAVIVHLTRRMLENLGYQVTWTTSSEEAAGKFLDNPENFDLVITDMTMPKMTGAELAQRILLARPDMPIILCTGFSELVNEKKAKAIGIREYIMKPVLIKDLALAVRRALDTSE